MVAVVSSPTEFLLVALAVWLTTGVTLAVVMGRRGHSAIQWFFIGAVLGPLALPIAWISIRDEGRDSARVLSEGAATGGPVDILVGIDGSKEAAAALGQVVELVGTNLGRLTLASVMTFDQGSVQAREDEARAVEALDGAARSVETRGPGRVLLTGQPADALMHHATVEGYDLLVVGRRGRGATKTLLGSTAGRIANGPIPVPVLIV